MTSDAMIVGDSKKMIVLIGLMGSGKTSVGRALALRLKLVFRDSDEAVEKIAKTSVREIFENQGEDVFRKLESQALVDLCDAKSSIVLAVAGGAIISQSNRDLLQRNSKCIVWLDAPTPTLISRTGRGKHRPLLDGDPVGSLNKMRLDREPLYQRLATHRLVTQSLTIDEVVERIMSLCSLETSSASLTESTENSAIR